MQVHTQILCCLHGGRTHALAAALLLSLAALSCDLTPVYPEPFDVPTEVTPAQYQAQAEYLNLRMGVLTRDSTNLTGWRPATTTLCSAADLAYARSQLDSATAAAKYWSDAYAGVAPGQIKFPSSAQILYGLSYLRTLRQTILTQWLPDARKKLDTAKARNITAEINYYTHKVNNLITQAGSTQSSPCLISDNIAVLLADSAIVIARASSPTVRSAVTSHNQLAGKLVTYWKDLMSLMTEGLAVHAPGYDGIPQFIWSEPNKDNPGTPDINEGTLPDPLVGFAGSNDPSTHKVNELLVGSGIDDAATPMDESLLFTIDQILSYWTADDNEPSGRQMGRLSRIDASIAHWEAVKGYLDVSEAERSSAQAWITLFAADKARYYSQIAPYLTACKQVQLDNAGKVSPETLLQMYRALLAEELRITRERLRLVQILIAGSASPAS